MKTKAGYISVIGRPNAGKSALINFLLDDTITMVSHKQNATRKRSLCIIHHNDAQMIFVDTPGIHHKEKLLNQFMLKEAMLALNDCDICLFLSPLNDDLKNYEDFLALNKNKPHIILLTKIDLYPDEYILKKLQEFSKYQDKFIAIIPISIKHQRSKTSLLNTIHSKLPEHPFFFDSSIMTTQSIKDICKEFIMEGIFEKLSDEIPYESDVIIEEFKENVDGKDITHIHATVIVEKSSQKIVLIGKNGDTIKRISKYSRLKIEKLLNQKVFLKLFVSVKKGWSKSLENLKKQGYDINV
jgi:GTP-binding protein Era